MNVSIPLFNIYWDDSDVKSVIEVIKSGKNWANGPQIEEFEEKICSYMDSKYAVSFNNGTSALHALLLSSGINPGDEVIVPSFTFISTANACLFVGAKPVFADIEPKFMGLDPEDVINKITKKTKAIIPIHFGGCPCRINELKEIANDNNLLLIEDNAESMGATIDNKKVGTFGDHAILSFCQNKIITTGEGGAVITDSREILHKLRLIRSHGRLEKSDYFSSYEPFDYISLGYNFRIPTMNAALGISQLGKIEEIIKLRKKNAGIYSKKLKTIPGVKIPTIPKNISHVYQMYSIFLNSEKRNSMMAYLSGKGIASKVYFDPVHLSKFYQKLFKYKKDMLPVTEEISNSILSLPMYPTLKEEEIRYICDVICSFMEESN